MVHQPFKRVLPRRLVGRFLDCMFLGRSVSPPRNTMGSTTISVKVIPRLCHLQRHQLLPLDHGIGPGMAWP